MRRLPAIMLLITLVAILLLGIDMPKRPENLLIMVGLLFVFDRALEAMLRKKL